MELQKLIVEFGKILENSGLAKKVKTYINIKEEKININFIQKKNFGYIMKDYLEDKFKLNYPNMELCYNIYQNNVDVEIKPKEKMNRKEIIKEFYKVIKFLINSFYNIKEKY